MISFCRFILKKVQGLSLKVIVINMINIAVRISDCICSYNLYLWLIDKQAGADITGQLQVRPILYTLYIDINLRVVKMLHTDNKQQITK